MEEEQNQIPAEPTNIVPGPAIVEHHHSASRVLLWIGILIITFAAGATSAWAFLNYQDFILPEVMVNEPVNQEENLPVVEEEEEVVPELQWSTFSNPQTSLTFEYPEYFNDPVFNPNETKALYSISANGEGKNLMIYVAADGFGPFFPHRGYELEKYQNGYKIINTIDQQITENHSKTTHQITASSNDYLFIQMTGPIAEAESLNEQAESILNSIKFSEYISELDWENHVMPEYNLSFKAPADFEEEISGPNNDTILRGSNGRIAFALKEEPFDKNNVVGPYGKVEKPFFVTIGSRPAVYYGGGDAGCGAITVLTSYAPNQTLSVNFSACEGGFIDDPLYQNTNLIEQILSTFKFN